MESIQPPAKVPKLSKGEEEQERVIKLLEEHLAKHDENRKAVQDKLHEICEELKEQIDELENRFNKELEEKFISEDNRLQTVLSELRESWTVSALQKAKAELLVEQSYKILENKKVNNDLTSLYELKAERRIVPELIEKRKPTNVRVADVDGEIISVQFACISPDEERVLSDHAIVDSVKYKCLLFKKDNEQWSTEYPLDKNKDNDSSFLFMPDILGAETTYGIRVKMVFGDRESEWSDEVAEFTTPEFKECCVWKKCPYDVNKWRKYSVDGKNPRTATKISDDDYFCTIIGNTHIPLNKVTSWNVEVLKSRYNNGYDVCIGAVQFDINQGYNYNKCGWYFGCYSSVLYSGPPHKYRGKEYGPRKEEGEYVHTGDSVGVVVDATRGDLSFILNGVNYGVAYEGIPLDKPLVPCVILRWEGDSVELII